MQLIFRSSSLDVESANNVFRWVCWCESWLQARWRKKTLTYLRQIGTAELPLWAERDPSLGLAAAQAVKSSDVVQGT